LIGCRIGRWGLSQNSNRNKKVTKRDCPYYFYFAMHPNEI
jgi:hypothetical protein